MLGHAAISETPLASLPEQLSASATFDTVDLSDGFIFQRKTVKSDREDIADVFLKRLLLTFTDNIRVVDQSAQVYTPPPKEASGSDTVDILDANRRLLTKRIAEQADISDAVFLHELLQTIAATDRQTFTDQVIFQLITRDLRFFEQVDLRDVSDEQIITAAQSLEAAMAGIRTFTCTPGYAIQRDAMTLTSVVDFDNTANFSNFSRSNRPGYKFRVPILALTKIQVDSLNAFHAFHQGARPFFWDGGRYGYISQPNLIGEGDSSRKDFWLWNRNIDPNSIAVAIYDGVTTSFTTAFSLYATAGMISLATAPLSGHDVMAAHAHKYKLVFEPDGLRTEEIFSGIFRAELILREIL